MNEIYYLSFWEYLKVKKLNVYLKEIDQILQIWDMKSCKMRIDEKQAYHD